MLMRSSSLTPMSEKVKSTMVMLIPRRTVPLPSTSPRLATSLQVVENAVKSNVVSEPWEARRLVVTFSKHFFKRRGRREHRRDEVASKSRVKLWLRMNPKAVARSVAMARLLIAATIAVVPTESKKTTVSLQQHRTWEVHTMISLMKEGLEDVEILVL